MFRKLPILVAALTALSLSFCLGQSKLTFRPADPLNPAAFQHFYDMYYERSIQEFTQVLQRHPDDPDAVNHLLTAVLFRELDRIGALNAGDYANDSFINSKHRPADPKVCDEIKQLVSRAQALEDKRLEANAKDVGALYSRGVTRAQFATYTALIERAWFSALRNALGARHDHERVLELDPNNGDAKLIVGAHNYVIGSLPWGIKAATTVVGLGGNKDKGLQYLHEAAQGTSETSIDARIILVVFLRREGRLDESLQLLRGLIPQYPHNVLFALEEGNLLRAKKQTREAEAVYRRVWDEGRAGKYVGLRYELATTALGDLLRSEKNYEGAAAAYDLIAQVQKPEPGTAQRAVVGAGEMYDLLHRREVAVKRYETALAMDGNSDLAQTAKKRLKEPYTGG
ncbi:MAG TPA: tetratricopeptide repeat protein [Terriglobales bacterium]|nr:tetratricopeptide repeat protein [Terriglobales bacterium]